MIKSVKKTYEDQEDPSYQSVRDCRVTEIRLASRHQRFQRNRNSKFQGSKHYDKAFYKFDQTEGMSLSDYQYQQKIKKFIDQTYTTDMLPFLLTNLKSGNLIDVHIGLIGVRKLLCFAVPPINEILNLQIVDILFQLGIQQSLDHRLQFQIAWCFLNITSYCSDEANDTFVQKGLIKILLDFLDSQDFGIYQMATIGISNLASCSAEIKLKILQLKGLEKIIKNVMEKFEAQDRKPIEASCYCISSFYFGEEIQNQALLKTGIQLISCMFECNCISDPDIVYFCIEAMFKNCFQISQKEHYQSVITKQVLEKLLSYTASSDIRLSVAALKNIGNYIAKYQGSTEILVSLNIFDYIEICLQSQNHTIRRQACWILSNLALSCKEIFIRKKMISKILIMLFQDNTTIKKEIIYIMANLSLTCGQYQIEEFFIENEIFNAMMEMLKQDDTNIVLSVIRNLYHMLYAAKGRDKDQLITQCLVRNGDIKVIENLQQSQSDKIYKYAFKVLNFFDNDIVPQ